MVTTDVIQFDADYKKGFSQRNQELIWQSCHFLSVNMLIAKQAVSHSFIDIHRSIGVSDYPLTQSLPENLKSSLPSIEEIEAKLSRGDYE